MSTNTEIMPALALEISNHHEAAQRLALETRETAQQALEHAVRCGDYLDQAEGMQKGKMLAWLRDNVPGITPERAKAYLSLFHTQERRSTEALDHRQLILLGVVDQAAMEAKPKGGGASASKWVGWVGNLRGYFTDALKARPITEWAQEEREAVADQLRPLVDLYQKLQ
jgi:hypothetical protein